MKCPNCGTTLDDDAEFCVKCGQKIEIENKENSVKEETSNVTEPKETAKKELGKVNVRMIVGILIMIVGVIRIATVKMGLEEASFGADFYTYTYEGIYAIATILKSINVTLGWILIAIGASMTFKGNK